MLARPPRRRHRRRRHRRRRHRSAELTFVLAHYPLESTPFSLLRPQARLLFRLEGAAVTNSVINTHRNTLLLIHNSRDRRLRRLHHLHTCTQHEGATSGAHEHKLTTLQRLFTKVGYKMNRKHVPHSRGLKKADLLIKDFQLQGVRDVIVDVTCRHEFHGSCANQQRNGEPSDLDVNGALEAAVKEKLDHCQHDYNERNFFFLPAVTTTSGRISGDFLRLLYILSHRQAANYFTRMGIIDPSPQAFIQTTPRLVLLFQSRRHRPRVRPGHCNEDRHRPTQVPSQKAPSPRPRPPPLSHPSTRPPP
jgi:hypothetical protein